jgi:hypothetical protein
VLFILSEKLLDICSKANGAELDGLQNLLLSVRQGRHAISGKKALFSTLAKNNALSNRERATALNLANRSAELPLLERTVKNKILVLPHLDQKLLREGGEFGWQVDVKELRFKFLDSLVVLAENSTDAELYRRAAMHYQISRKIKGVLPCSSARGGGGSQIDVELKNLVADGIPVFAITDGDYLFPGMGESHTASRCAALVGEQRGMSWHYGLPTREVENIIPVDILFSVSDPANSDRALSSTKQLESTTEKLKSCPCNYVCFKKGITLARIFESENPGEREYWLSVAEAMKHLRSKSFQQCLQNGSCGRGEACDCEVSHGFGENVLRQVKAWIDEQSSHSSLQRFGKSKVWMGIGEMIFDASIAFRPANV